MTNIQTQATETAAKTAAKTEAPATEAAPLHTLIPRVDVFHGDAGYQLIGDLPGVAAADLEVRFDNGVLSLKGVARQDGEPWFQYERAFNLPETIDVEGLTAGLDAGVLTLTLPIAAHARPRMIPVTLG